MEDFSFCQRVFNWVRVSRSLASSSRSFSRRSRDATSVSFSNAISSISRRRTMRSAESISSGEESISMRSRDAASSTRSMALSGRNRDVM